MHADLDYLKGIMDAYKPDVVVSCGLQAEGAVRGIWSGYMLAIPHPASRVLTNSLLNMAHKYLYGMVPFVGRVALRQKRTGVVLETVPVVEYA